MLIEFRVANFKSVREEQVWSMVADSGREHRETHTVPLPGAKDLRLVRSAVLYGPNASGKSTIVQALSGMRRAVLTSAHGADMGDPISGGEPFRLDADWRRRPTRFDVTFLQQGVRYHYGFAATTERVVEEWLYSFPRQRERHWFTRVNDEFSFGPSLGSLATKEVVSQATRPNALFLSTAVQLNTTDLLPVFEWFRTILLFPTRAMPSITTRWAQNDEGRCARLVEFLRKADVGIHDFVIERQRFDDDMWRALVGKSQPKGDVMHLGMMQGTLSGDSPEITRIRFRHTGHEDPEAMLDLQEESEGTQQLWAIAGPLFDALANGRVLVLDEIDSSLHPLVVRELLALFHHKESTSTEAQLLGTTHDVTLLDQKFLRRDQVWFTEKTRDGATRLFPLTDFRPRHNVEALARNYLNGRYGAIPLLEIQSSIHAETDTQGEIEIET